MSTTTSKRVSDVSAADQSDARPEHARGDGDSSTVDAVGRRTETSGKVGAGDGVHSAAIGTLGDRKPGSEVEVQESMGGEGRF